MKRLPAILIIGLTLFLVVSDIVVLIDYFSNPMDLSLLIDISLFHYFFISQNIYLLVLCKLAFSLIVLVMWTVRVIYPATVTVLGYITQVYALFIVFIGFLALTGILGVLQGVAKMTVNPLDFTLLTLVLDASELALIVGAFLIFPIAFWLLPKINNAVLNRE